MKWEIPWKKWRDKAPELLGKYKYVLLVMLAGAVLLLWPSGKKETPPQAVQTPIIAQEEGFDLCAMEEKLAQILSKVRGAGDVSVMLTAQGSERRVLAEDEKNVRAADGGSETQSTTVVVSGSGGSGEGPVLVQRLYPRLQGALVVCQGGDKADVRLKLMQAVSALTGLGADKITICEGKG